MTLRFFSILTLFLSAGIAKASGAGEPNQSAGFFGLQTTGRGRLVEALAVPPLALAPDERNWHPKEDPAAAQEAAVEPGGAGWIVGGVLVGALTLGVPLGIAAEAPKGNVGLGIGVGLAAGVVGGVGGYYLGRLARDGSSPAKHSIVILGVIDAVVGVAAVVIAATFKLNLSPFPVY